MPISVKVNGDLSGHVLHMLDVLNLSLSIFDQLPNVRSVLNMPTVEFQIF